MMLDDVDKLLARHDAAVVPATVSLSSKLSDIVNLVSRLDAQWEEQERPRKDVLNTILARIDAAEFKEEEHPRDEGGKFAKGFGVGSKVKITTPNWNTDRTGHIIHLTKKWAVVKTSSGTYRILSNEIEESTRQEQAKPVESKPTAKSAEEKKAKSVEQEKTKPVSKSVEQEKAKQKPIETKKPVEIKRPAETTTKQVEETVNGLKKVVPELKYYKHLEPKEGRDRHWILISTEVNNRGVPKTIPGDETATGMAVSVNPKTKEAHFSELNSHIRGAGRRMVEEFIRSHPGYKFSVSDWSQATEEASTAPSFWDKIKSKYPGRFKED